MTDTNQLVQRPASLYDHKRVGRDLTNNGLVDQTLAHQQESKNSVNVTLVGRQKFIATRAVITSCLDLYWSFRYITVHGPNRRFTIIGPSTLGAMERRKG